MNPAFIFFQSGAYSAEGSLFAPENLFGEGGSSAVITGAIELLDNDGAFLLDNDGTQLIDNPQ